MPSARTNVIARRAIVFLRCSFPMKKTERADNSNKIPKVKSVLIVKMVHVTGMKTFLMTGMPASPGAVVS